MADSAAGGERWDERLMRWVWVGRPAPASIEERTRRRVWIHLLPLLFFLYILAYIDRSNISIAMLGMNLSPEAGGGSDSIQRSSGSAAGYFSGVIGFLKSPAR